MPRPVKTQANADSTAPKPERSTYRQEQAALTRDRIAAASRELFAAAGYKQTSMEAIAARAGVAPRTVYSAFGAKREILSAICDRWLQEAHAFEIIGATVAEPDATRTLRLSAYFLRSLFEHGYDVVNLFEAASDEDPETSQLLRAKLNGRNQAQGAMIATVAADLVVPLPVAQAVFRALAATGIYRELVVESGWSMDDYEDWIAESLCRQLLGRSAPPERPRL